MQRMEVTLIHKGKTKVSLNKYNVKVSKFWNMFLDYKEYRQACIFCIQFQTVVNTDVLQLAGVKNKKKAFQVTPLH